MKQGILIFCEAKNGKIKKSSFELATVAKSLLGEIEGELSALIIGYQIKDEASLLGRYGVNKVYVADQKEFEHYNTLSFASLLKARVDELNPALVFGSASILGKDLFPRVAAEVNSGLASDCIEVEINSNKVLAKRPVFAGKASVQVEFLGEGPHFLTLRPNIFPVSDPTEEEAEVVTINSSINFSELAQQVKEITQGTSDKPDLTEADIIVSGGRSLKSAENFSILHELADIIGATVGASRAAVDAGYAAHSMQVGQTGKVVNPKLYIACGISGAIQHLAGMRTSKVIVAINKDPQAPIFKKANYGIVGDLFEIVPLLSKACRKLLS